MACARRICAPIGRFRAPGRGFARGYTGRVKAADIRERYLSFFEERDHVRMPSASLAVAPDGFGRVTINPEASVYTLGANVTLTATPDSGQTFLGWSGDASGTTNPLLITMNQSKVITAGFTRRPILTPKSLLDGPTADGFRFTLTGEFGGHYRIDVSANLAGWSQFAVITNTYGQTQLTDPAGATQGRINKGT